nr:hypothetical protein [Human alphaherpesvirus 1]AWW10949.1 hypothetical protein [Human alphaherpesvirus 1]
MNSCNGYTGMRCTSAPPMVTLSEPPRCRKVLLMHTASLKPSVTTRYRRARSGSRPRRSHSASPVVSCLRSPGRGV